MPSLPQFESTLGVLLASKRILIAEHDPKARRALARYLVSRSCRVVLADDAFELASVLTGDDFPHAMLVSLWLGDANALEIMERHPAPKNQDWPALLMSAELRNRDVALAEKVGIRRWLRKPLDFIELEEALVSVLTEQTAGPHVSNKFTLSDLLQALHLQRRTVGLAVAGPPEGTVTLVRGEVVDAQCGQVLGEHAIDLMVHTPANSVHTFTAPRAIQATIQRMPMVELLSRAHQRLNGSRPIRRLTPRDTAAVMDALEVVGKDPTPSPESDLPSSELPFSISVSPPSSYPPGESILPEFTSDLPLTDTETAILHEAGKLIPELQLGRVEHRPLTVRWLTAQAAAAAKVQSLVTQVISLVVKGEEWVPSHWLALVRMSSDGEEKGVGVFGVVPWVSGAAFSGRWQRERFYATTTKLALVSGAEAKPKRRKTSQSTLAFPSPDFDMDELSEPINGLCQEMVEKGAELLMACMLVEQNPHAAVMTTMRGRYTADVNELVVDPRWRIGERLFRALLGSHDAELFIGATTKDSQTLMGVMIDEKWLLLCLSKPSRTLGALRNEVRARRAWLREALNKIKS